MNIYFYTKHVRQDGTAQLHFLIRLNGCKISCSTPIRVVAEKFQASKQRYTKCSRFTTVEADMMAIRLRMEKVYRELLEQHQEPTVELLKKYYTQNTVLQKTSVTLHHVIQEFLQHKKLLVSPNTMIALTTAFLHFAPIADKNCSEITKDDIVKLFQGMTSKNYKSSSIKAYIVRYSTLRLWVKKTYSIELPAVTPTNVLQHQQVHRKTLPITALDSTELARFIASAKAFKEINLRTFAYGMMFTLLCYSGQRVSDYHTLQHILLQHSEKPQYVSLVQQKTKKNVLIPISSAMWELWTELRLHVPITLLQSLPTTKGEYFTQKIRTIAKHAELQREVDVYRMINGKEVLQKRKLYEVIATHDGRRTFITNALRAKIERRLITRVTGHEKLDIFEQYVRLTDADLLQEFENFTI